ncbi:tRNA nucleotidyltransferase cca2 isoform X2 [Diospyros lotus]|uniref:tRNA nucleotidyltransferase cca2 isoform X2 n=1 Tax=Diospyros lotus TaxID=55363 RepID=UPI00225522ED|nr:tRNA nucleotidyltransferase cca2 isoform X2 [Diospyros lotus]
MNRAVAAGLNAHRLFAFPASLNPPKPKASILRLRLIKPNIISINSSLHFRFLGFSRPHRAMSTPASPPRVPVRDKIDLTGKEKQIFDRLLQVLRHFNLQTQLRVAGGWVRDKLLGKDCYDIDIAIDNMLGREFCEKVNEYLSTTGEEAQGIGIIQCNPDQSKHLETARMRLFDIWIDFVNLRSEDYSENSRIPTMRFGTAEEDAYRRDLTINSLFYNINTSSVEDFTGRGITDLKSGKIVTPLPPKETFLDDPLRVLRAIRFGARFGFILDDELKRAASADDVKAAIAGKISRERIGHEIDLMVSGNQPLKAISCITDLLLFWVVFSLPPEVDPPLSRECERICIACIDFAWNLMQLIGSSVFSVPVVNYIFRNSLKLKASDAETVINLHNATKKFVSLIPCITSDNENTGIAEIDWGQEILDVPVASKLRILTGLLLREIKDFWRVALLVSLLYYPADVTTESSAGQLKLEKRKELFGMVEKEIVELGLERVWEMKPLVNGKDIMSVLQLKTGGPLVREWQQKLLEWQLAHPHGTSEDCLDWMRETHTKRARVE